MGGNLDLKLQSQASNTNWMAYDRAQRYRYQEPTPEYKKHNWKIKNSIENIFRAFSTTKKNNYPTLFVHYLLQHITVVNLELVTKTTYIVNIIDNNQNKENISTSKIVAQLSCLLI